MIGAPLLLLIGITGPFEVEGPVMAQLAAPARPDAAAAKLPNAEKRERKHRAVRRVRRNDMTETLRAMNMMQIGMEPPAQRTGANQ